MSELLLPKKPMCLLLLPLLVLKPPGNSTPDE